jgi:hypothetical protein
MTISDVTHIFLLLVLIALGVATYYVFRKG